MSKLSVVLATLNEEKNIKECLDSVKKIADEIVVVDENSTDNTRQIAKEFGAKVFKAAHEPIFHVSKQKALDHAMGDWILQLDADERLSKALSNEIKQVINSDSKELASRVVDSDRKKTLFRRHQLLLEQRDGPIGTTSGDIVAFFIPRRNYFLGKPLEHAGVYPDGVIRLVKKGFASFPSKSVHEQIQIDGKVAWLTQDLEHYDSPTLSRYLVRLNRYTTLKSEELRANNISKNLLVLVYFAFLKPTMVFLNLFVRHKGYLDGARGFLWSFFSASHFPIAYFKYYAKTSKS